MLRLWVVVLGGKGYRKEGKVVIVLIWCRPIHFDSISPNTVMVMNKGVGFRKGGLKPPFNILPRLWVKSFLGERDKEERGR